MKYIISGVLVLVFAGCTTTFRPWKLSDVKEGMARDQVVQLLGEPDSVVLTNNMEYLYYSYQENYNPPGANSINQDLSSPERKLMDKQIKASMKTSKYAVQLVDGKVLSYKELPAGK